MNDHITYEKYIKFSEDVKQDVEREKNCDHIDKLFNQFRDILIKNGIFCEYYLSCMFDEYMSLYTNRNKKSMNDFCEYYVCDSVEY